MDDLDETCAVTRCRRSTWCSGLCERHYYSNPDAREPAPLPPKPRRQRWNGGFKLACSQAGCSETSSMGDWCDKHVPRDLLLDLAIQMGLNRARLDDLRARFPELTQ